MPPKSTSRKPPTSSARTVVAAIPVRYASTRLPGKPLVSIAGVPMIERVYRRVAKARGIERVVVLTDDERIARVVSDFGGDVEMTREDCVSGTDRIASVADRWATDAILNVQGDEPLIDPSSLEALATHLRTNVADPVATLAAPAAPEELTNPDVVKVVTDLEGYALFFSRAAIPFARNPRCATPLRHIGVYGYQTPSLLEIAACEPTPLERTEALEQLRMLENGFSIRVLRTPRAWPAVDTMDDLRRVELLLRERPELAEP
ncbi:MAG: 3-deoxy-manno-octulosonate cytidylyltransferase [Acidobacteriota bacterium]|nr:3-deoxy-manno-octulosonate cytidylyltransferase [Acidobacteriota bacterium]